MEEPEQEEQATSTAELTPPPPPQIKSTAGNGTNSEGDWTCAECGNLNYARRVNCNRCHKSKGPTVSASKKRKLGHEIGKAAAEKSRGLFSAEDWQCNKCGNVNWARRQQCNVCNAPKFGDLEERTGFGGGYNDRGVVEYKDRPDSDDEYDEFGRKKKKRNEDDNYDEEKRDDAKEDGEEDEEEDDDDGDLSKYDLSDWGDSNEGNNSKHSNDKDSNSRSRSPHEQKN